MSTTPTETEVKIRWAGSAEEAQRHILNRGYHLSVPRVHETNQLFDRAFPPPEAENPVSGELRSTDRTLRLRRSVPLPPQDGAPIIESRVVLTYKGPTQGGRYKKREEIEADIRASDADSFVLVLERLGYRITFRYEKIRSVYKKDGEAGLITLDETPMGIFLELEGPESWIDATANNLGYTPAEYVVTSYQVLYAEYRSKRPNCPKDMTFVVN